MIWLRMFDEKVETAPSTHPPPWLEYRLFRKSLDCPPLPPPPPRARVSTGYQFFDTRRVQAHCHEFAKCVLTPILAVLSYIRFRPGCPATGLCLPGCPSQACASRCVELPYPTAPARRQNSLRKQWKQEGGRGGRGEVGEAFNPSTHPVHTSIHPSMHPFAISIQPSTHSSIHSYFHSLHP